MKEKRGRKRQEEPVSDRIVGREIRGESREEGRRREGESMKNQEERKEGRREEKGAREGERKLSFGPSSLTRYSDQYIYSPSLD